MVRGYKQSTGTVFTTFDFFVTYVPQKLERYTTLGQKGLTLTNTLAYWVHS